MSNLTLSDGVSQNADGGQNNERQRESCPICGMTLHNCAHTIEEMIKLGRVNCELAIGEIEAWKRENDVLHSNLIEYGHRITSLEHQLDTAEGAIQKIDNWARAYPEDIFIEPDWEEVNKLLGSKLLTAVSASNMRHVINGVKEIIEKAKKEIGD